MSRFALRLMRHPHTRSGVSPLLQLGLPLILAAVSFTNVARGIETRDASDSLSSAEQAYQKVDYPATYEAACSALQQGRANVRQTLRLNVLCGIAAAALEKPEEARVHFRTALAIDPNLKLERDLSPKIRGPYLEAQGSWASADNRLALGLVKRDDSLGLHFEIQDPAHLVASLRVLIRGPHDSQFRPLAAAPDASVNVALPSELVGTTYSYYALLVDASGNALRELGSATDPYEVRASLTPDHRAPVTHPAAPSPNDTGASWFRWTLLGTGLAATAAGVYFNIQREDRAKEWNSPACEQPGPTRMAQCGSIDAERARDQRAAIGLYAAGGLLIATSVTLWALDSPEHPRTPASATSALACGASLPSPGIACTGSF